MLLHYRKYDDQWDMDISELLLVNSRHSVPNPYLHSANGSVNGSINGSVNGSVNGLGSTKVTECKYG